MPSESRGLDVVIHEGLEQVEDPGVTSFLELLGRSIEEQPEDLVPVTPDLFARVRALTEGVEVGVDERIEGHVDI